MTVTHSEIRSVLFHYLEHYRYPPEADHLVRLVRALDEGHDVTSPTEFRIGHLTIGAIVVDQDRRVLMVRHTTPERWLLPSGFLRSDDENLVGAALRKLREETAIPRRLVTAAPEREAVPFDIDVHRVPPDPAGGEPGHWHFDFRYAHWAEEADVRPILGKHPGYAWVPVDALRQGGLRDKLGVVEVG